LKTIIAGSRAIKHDLTIIEEAVAEVSWEITEVVSGTARGVDRLGEKWAKLNNLPVKRFPALWGEYGRSAGYIRNVEMAKYSDALIAVWDGISQGTKHMIIEAAKKKLHISVKIYSKK
jgi:hypothetical protein